MLMEKNVNKVMRSVWTIILICLLLTGCEKSKQIELQEASSREVEGADSAIEKETEQMTTDQESAEKQETEKAKQSEVIAVFVCGAVEKSGVYELHSGARVCEAIDAAGGLAEDASVNFLNQAEVMTDGQKLYVPTNQEVDSGQISSGDGSAVLSSNTESEKGKVNINSASKEELMTIPGIGEAKANSIIQYRETKGKFTSIEDIMNIEGIKEGVFQKIQDQITV